MLPVTRCSLRTHRNGQAIIISGVPTSTIMMVSGNPSHLKRHAVAARIRALLLAGIRAAVLWRQSGGGRLHMLLLRKRYTRIAQSLLLESRR